MNKALITLIDNYWDNPVWFAEDMLGFKADKWQSDVLMSIANYPKVSVRSGQGVGKTGLESIVIVWYLLTRPFPKVVATAPTRQQLYDVLWAEVAKWLVGSKVEQMLEWTKTKIYMKGYSERWWATAKTATRPENMQGFHEDYMLFVVDEASGVADPIMEAILGTLSGAENKLLLCGNPTRTSGTFYDSHNRDRDLYKTFKVSSMESPRTSKENIEMLKRKYHEGSDPWRVRVLGEFPKGESDSLISLEAVEMATMKEVNINNDYILNIGADIARYGADETIIAPRIGGKVFDLLTYSKQSTMETAGCILRAVDKFKNIYGQINKVKIKTDDDGLGAGVTDRLKEVVYQENLKYEIIPIQNGSDAIEKSNYYNKASEMWDVVRQELDENLSNYLQGREPTIQLPNDDKLIKQLSNRKYSIDSKGRIQIESKKEMKKRIGESPDRADAVIYSFAENRNTELSLLKGGRIWG
ncbi:DEAD/DEAH box helicase family protein [Clostridium senegalense]|uniref:DEAD/DEAH box helicase family protein n=1 Tax=Clostridium senegalense TaxID=1465809 RepID=UPI0002883C8F|nr:DEAD/DEAH box helicase family protein [Clostridium senegalense]